MSAGQQGLWHAFRRDPSATPFRLKLYQLASDDWIALACTHHVIVDFWSLVVILQELRQGLAHFSRGPQASGGRVPNEFPSGANYADFVRDQGELLRSPRGQTMQSYWLEQAQRASPGLDRLHPNRSRSRAVSGYSYFVSSAIPTTST